MTRALIAALMLAGCSENSSAPSNVAEPAATVVPSPGSAATPLGTTLTGSTSALQGDISGLNVRTSDTRIFVDLPADTLFDFDRADITRAAEANLGKVAELIRLAPAGMIEITGYTDAKGDDTYNLQLSEQRAQSVVNWMREQVGVRQRQFQAIGKGEADPVAANETPDGKDNPAGRTQNRRVIVSIPR